MEIIIQWKYCVFNKQILKVQGNTLAPRNIAQSIVDNLPENEIIDKVSFLFLAKFLSG